LPVSDIIMVTNKPYYVLSLLGKGGSSQVFLVYEPQKKCLLAIKCINLDVTDESINDAYKNEIRLLQKLQHSDRVIKLHDFEFNCEKNCLYVVMEKGDTDLGSVIRTYARNGQITAEMIKFYWSEMLKTVAVIHKAGIIHSDLKPANFLLVGGRMKLIDFGISSSLQTDMTSVIKDVQVGTFNYMSPEAIQDTTQDYEGRRQPLFKINVKSDVWSLGCILYNLVYGKTPFQDIRQPVAKMQAIVNSSHEISFPDIPNKQLIEVMKKCLLRDQKQRLSIEELLEHSY
uniref:Protein kinase domain-containing protein n=1 Tax=Strigamia maritima TaxID=126957 RepID=T1JMM9_STRMM